MARKIPGATPSTASKNKPVKNSKAKKQSKPLFSFGRKNQIEKSRENLRTSEDVYEEELYDDDDYEDYEDYDDYDDYKDNQGGYGEERNLKGNNMTTDDSELSNKQNDFFEDPEERVVPFKEENNSNDYDKKPHITYNQADKLYNKRQMEQSVFLYAKSDYFPVIQQHYNKEFSDIRTIGTSSLIEIEKIFSERAMSKFIMLFVLEQNEISYVKEFINSLHLEQIQPNVMNILLIIDSRMDVENIITTETQRKFVQVKSLNQEKTPLTKSILNKLMSVVVNQQPSYIPPKKGAVAPKKVNPNSLTKDISRLNSNDLTSLKQTIEDMKKNSLDNDQRKQLMSSILSNTDVNNMLSKVDEIPHLRLIKAVEAEVEENLELIKHNPRMRDQVEEMITRKLLLATLRTAEMEELMSDIIDTAVSRIESVDSGLRDYNKNAVEELKEAGGHDELLAKREEIKQDINKRFSQYKTLIQLISNSSNLQALSYKNTKNELGNMINNNKGNISSDILTVSTNQMQIMDSRKDQYLQQVKLSHGRMVEALDITNKLLESYKILVSLDDIVINSLLEENEVLRQMQPVRVNVQSVFKSNGVNIISLPGSGMLTIFDTFLKPTDLIIYYGGRNMPNEIMDVEQYSLEDFLSSNWDKPQKAHLINLSYQQASTNPMQMISQSEYDITNPSVMERLIAKLDYVSGNYGNIYIIYEPTETDIENINTDVTFKYFINHLKNLVIWTPMTKNNAVMTAMINEALPEGMLSVKIFLNKVGKSYEKELQNFKRIVNAPITTLIIPYISNIEGQLSSERDQVKVALKNIKNRMR